MPAPGTKAPDFTLPDQSGEMHSLHAYRGSWVLLYFYPKDNTPGCTKQACTLRDSFETFSAEGCVVLGVSADSVKSHASFHAKQKLPFPLLADTEKSVAKAYGVWAPKKFMGREFLGVLRTSFLINPEGVVVKIYERVKPQDHATEVLTDLRAHTKNVE